MNEIKYDNINTDSRLMKISLIGLRGTGKTSIGKMLAQRISQAASHTIDFVDSDVLIESMAGKNISQIFTQDGEATFRDIEATIISQQLQRPDQIILATGGGAILREATRQLLRQQTCVFWLTASVETMALRISGDTTTADRRPKLTDLPAVAEIEKLQAIREPLYRETAHVCIQTENKPLSAIVDEIASFLAVS